MLSSTLPSSQKRFGAVAVEFAIVSPIMFLLVMGIIELARVYMVSELITEAARKGCRAAIIEGSSSTQIKAAATNCLAIVGISAETVNISVNDAPLDSVDPQSMPINTEITVVVKVPVSSVSWVPFPAYTGSRTLSGQFTLRRQ
jgi:Flp pilus assembly protein TadG